MGKVIFDMGIDSVTGMLMSTDSFYIRRYPGRNGEIMHIVQRRPNRSGHVPTPAEAANRTAFGIRFGRERSKKFKEPRDDLP